MEITQVLSCLTFITTLLFIGAVITIACLVSEKNIREHDYDDLDGQIDRLRTRYVELEQKVGELKDTIEKQNKSESRISSNIRWTISEMDADIRRLNKNLKESERQIGYIYDILEEMDKQ